MHIEIQDGSLIDVQLNIYEPPRFFEGFLRGRNYTEPIFVFAIITLNANLPGGKLMAIVVVCTVLLSVLAHGFSANPLAKAFAARMRQHGEAGPSQAPTQG